MTSLNEQKNRKRNGFSKSKYGCLSIIAIFFILAIVGSCAGGGKNKTEQLQPSSVLTQQQKAEIFTEWYSKIEKQLNASDVLWKRANSAIELYGSGKTTRYKAYDELNSISEKLKNISFSIEKINPPANLPKDDIELLQSAIGDLSNSLYTRGNAMSKMTDIIDAGKAKPSEIKPVEFLIQSSNEKAQDAVVKITAVKISYGL